MKRKINLSDPDEVWESLPDEPKDKTFCGKLNDYWFYCHGFFLTQKGWFLFRKLFKDESEFSTGGRYIE